MIRTAAGTFFLCCVVTAGTLTAVAVGSGTAGADVPSVNWTHLSSASPQPTRNAAVMEHEPAIRCALANGRIAFTGPNTCVLDANYIAAKQFQQLITVDAQCPPGYYSATGSTPCTPADPGSFVAGAGATSETECAAGTYQPDSGQSSCLLADPGSFVATIGATSETECAAGTYQPDSGQSSCLLADPGSFVATAGATAESSCSTGTFSASAGATSCTLAPPGTYVNTTGAAAATDCALGTYQPDSGQSSCLLADPGSFVATAGATAEFPCSTGTFSASAGATSCTLAPPGTYVNTTGAAAATDCAAGTYQPDSGQSSCLLADPGSFVAAAGATAEFPCSTGTFSASAGATSCTLAPPGTYVNTTGAAAATDCALGTYQPDSGQTSCIPAPPNTYVDTEGATSPTPCPAGTFNPDSGSTSVAACVMVTVTNPGDQSDYVNAPITALTNSQTNGIGPVSWSATGLPAGLTIDPSSGTVTGTPTTPCTCSVTLKATDVDGNVGTAAFTWTVLPFGIVTTSLPTATPNVPYGPVTLQAAGLGVSASPYTTKLKWKEVTLPEGMTLSLSGVLSGTPNKHLAAGPSSITVRATETVITLNGTKKVKTKTTVQATIPLTIT